MLHLPPQQKRLHVPSQFQHAAYQAKFTSQLWPLLSDWAPLEKGNVQETPFVNFVRNRQQRLKMPHFVTERLACCTHKMRVAVTSLSGEAPWSQDCRNQSRGPKKVLPIARFLRPCGIFRSCGCLARVYSEQSVSIGARRQSDRASKLGPSFQRVKETL